MARRRLSTEEQKKGVEKALESPGTPSQLKKGLKKREQPLEGDTGRASSRNPSDANE